MIQYLKDIWENIQSVFATMGLVDYLDLLIPRGGAGLIKAVVENAKVPVIETTIKTLINKKNNTSNLCS